MVKAYKPRRASARYLDADCPAGVLCIMDNKGRTADRYTVIYAGTYVDGAGRVWLTGRGMSSDPFHPQGVGMSFDMQAHEVAAYRYAQKHTYAKWSGLPDAVKLCVKADLGV